MTPYTIVDGPVRVGNEQRWRVRLDDGRPAVLAALLPELASDPSLRRRYVADAERVASLRAPGLVPTLAIGPEPDPRAAGAAPPWRLRLDPTGETLEAWLAARAPAPLDETLDLVARLADALAEVHRAGAVLRDLRPAQVVLGAERLWLTDVGLARLDLLSSRSAHSLLLEGSPYAAPEHLRTTLVDARADLYSLGVVLWRALTGTLPFGDGPALLRERTALPSLATLRGGLPYDIDTLCAALLAEAPDGRPSSARDVAEALRGQPLPGRSLERTRCQACGAELRVGLRLCLSCGREAVQLKHTEDRAEARAIDLTSITDAQEVLGAFRAIALEISEPPARPLGFITGARGLYSKQEQKSLTSLPARVWSGLTPSSADLLARRLRAKGLKIKVRSQRRERRIRTTGWVGLSSMPIGIALGIALHSVPLGVFLPFLGLFLFALSRTLTLAARKQPLLQLKPGPTALPASDPLVAPLAKLLARAARPDLREQITELALVLQRLVDHRAKVGVAGRAEIDAVVAPAQPLVAMIEREVTALVTLDEELGTLEEGAMVRALAASQARKEPASAREPILLGLDRLRTLEDRRSQGLHRLLEAGALLRRAAELGLRVQDADTVYEAELAKAMAALDEG